MKDLKSKFRQRLAGESKEAYLIQLLTSINEEKTGLNYVNVSKQNELTFDSFVLSTSKMKVIALAISRCRKFERLNIIACELKSSLLQVFTTTLERSKVKISQLFFEENTNMGVEGLSEVGKICDRHGTNTLSLKNCKLCSEQIVSLKSSLGDAEIATFILDGNDNMGEKGLLEVGEMCKRHSTKKLSLEKCKLNSGQLHALKSSLGDTKIDSLCLDDDKFAEHEDMVAVLDLFPNVTDTIHLWNWKIKDDDRRMLQDELNRLKIELVISFGPGDSIRFIVDDCAPKSFIYVNEDVYDAYGDMYEQDDSEENDMSIPESARLDMAIETQISLAATKVENIDCNGGIVDLHGCVLKFPKNSLTRKTAVQITVSTTDPDLPSNSISFTPVLRCSLKDGKLHKPVIILLPTYFTTVDNDAVEVFCKKTIDGDWVKIDPIMYKNGETWIRFEVNHFCFFKGLVRKVFGFSRTLRIANYLFFKQEFAEFIVLCCSNDTKIKSDCCKTLEDGGCHKVSPLPFVLDTMIGQPIAFKLSCSSPDKSYIRPEDWKELRLCGVGSKCCDHLHFLLHDKPNQATDIDVQFSIKPEGGLLVENPLRIKYEIHNNMSGDEVTQSVDTVCVTTSSKNKFIEHRDDAGIYQISSNKILKGKILLINNYEFRGINERPGSEKDVENMEKLWLALGFNVFKAQNQTADEMRRLIADVAEDKTAHSVRVVIIMSHGCRKDNEDYITSSDVKPVRVSSIVDYFNNDKCPHLIGIPKLFIFQCCRVKSGGELLTDPGVEQTDNIKHPTIADRLVVFSTHPGFVSHRHSENGTWLINAITNVFTKHAHDTDVVSMMTEVNREVANRLSVESNKQMSEMTSNSLRKKLYLFPGNP